MQYNHIQFENLESYFNSEDTKTDTSMQIHTMFKHFSYNQATKA